MLQARLEYQALRGLRKFHVRENPKNLICGYFYTLKGGRLTAPILLPSFTARLARAT